MSIPDPVVLLDARARYVHPAFQMTRASTKTVFDATGKLVTVPVNALGWDHDPATGQARGYLAEPSATNLILHSNDLSDAAWSLNNSPTVTPNAIVGPDGAGMARVERTASGATSVFQAPTIVAGETVCGSFIAKAGEITAIEVRVGPSSGHVRYAVSLIDGSTVLPPTTGGTNAGQVELVGYGVEDLGGGFWRPWVAGRLAPDTTSATTHALLWAGGVGDGVYVGYVQTEKRSYPTSYIETGAATATRAGDSLVLPDLGDFPWWRSEQGTLLVDVEIPEVTRSGHVWGLDNQLTLRFQSTADRVVIFGTEIGGTGIVIDLSEPLGRYKISTAWDEHEVTAVSNGIVKTTINVIGAIAPDDFGLGSLPSGSNRVFARIRRAVYYPQRLSNADLQSLTALQE